MKPFGYMNGKPLKRVLSEACGSFVCLVGGLMLVGGVALIAAGAWLAGDADG